MVFVPVRDQDVRGDDTGAVDEDLAVDDGDGDVVTTESGYRAVRQRAAVSDSAVDDCECVSMCLSSEVMFYLF